VDFLLDILSEWWHKTLFLFILRGVGNNKTLISLIRPYPLNAQNAHMTAHNAHRSKRSNAHNAHNNWLGGVVVWTDKIPFIKITLDNQQIIPILF
tara:strand:- start:7 stop:291 length:285 start_codon:yes stop_codon:yes gene_type:complete